MKITVKYWCGTMQYEGIATTYRGAMRIASRNKNVYQPKFYDEQGRRLYDTSYGLAYENQPDPHNIVCVV